MPPLPSLAARLRWLRESKALSLQELGDRIGFDKSYLYRIEKGLATNPSSRFVAAVCAEFKVMEAWFAAGQGPVAVDYMLPGFEPDQGRSAALASVVLTSEDFKTYRTIQNFIREYSVVGALVVLLEGHAPADIHRYLERIRSAQSLNPLARDFWLQCLREAILQLASKSAEARAPQATVSPTTQPVTWPDVVFEVQSIPIRGDTLMTKGVLTSLMTGTPLSDTDDLIFTALTDPKF